MDPDDPASPDETALSRLYDLAEGLAAAITALAPDWCEIARDASELADAARRRCPDSTHPQSSD